MNHKNEACYLVYKHTNKINGKIYVGQTGLEPQERWRYNGRGYEHYWVDENGVKRSSHFWSAICKYGWNNFEHKVLIHGLTKSQADFWEKKLIKEWDLMNPEKGYNKKEGGSNGKHSEETIEKIRQSNLGKKMSKEACMKISKKTKGVKKQQKAITKMIKTLKEMYTNGELVIWNKNTKGLTKANKTSFKKGMIPWNKGKKCPQLSGENSPWYGKHHTEESKQKISESRKIKVIRLYDNKIYQSIQYCAKDNHKSINAIIRHCKNKNKTKLQEFMYYDEFVSK